MDESMRQGRWIVANEVRVLLWLDADATAVGWLFWWFTSLKRYFTHIVTWKQEIPISEIVAARPGIELWTSCCASQELYQYTTAAPRCSSYKFVVCDVDRQQGIISYLVFLRPGTVWYWVLGSIRVRRSRTRYWTQNPVPHRTGSQKD